MNGIIEYDQKLTSLPRFLFIHNHSRKNNYWNIIFFFTLVYHTVRGLLSYLVWRPTFIDITTIGVFFIRLDFIIDIAVIFSTYFFLKQLERRFQMLNDSWKYLLPGFLVIPTGELTHSITGMTLDKIRLLHAELSDLLRIFSVGYGKMLLGFVVFSYINMVIHFYYIINLIGTEREEFTFSKLLKSSVPYIKLYRTLHLYYQLSLLHHVYMKR